MWNRSQLKTAGKAAFRANYWPCVGVSLILLVMLAGGLTTRTGGVNLNVTGAGVPGQIITTAAAKVIGISGLVTIAFNIFAYNPIKVGCRSYYLKNTEAPCKFKAILDGFQNGNYINIVLGMFLTGIFTFLWGLLLVIPGIVKSYSYRMVPYILADDPTVEWKTAIDRSRKMMNGNKWAAFLLDLSFLGWNILAALTFGLLQIFYVAPYKDATRAELYKILKAQQVNAQ